MPETNFAGLISGWFQRNRRELPWRLKDAGRARREPYAVWVAEVMLQQTRAEVVGPYFERFLQRFPDVAALAAAPESEVLRCWAGLGYYRRARMLHAAAQEVVARLGGLLPVTMDAWRELPGIGEYTAAAIAAQAHGEARAAVDGNVKRVAARVLGLEMRADETALHGAARTWAQELMDRAEDPGVMVEALMELGATVCTPRAPRCTECPVAEDCAVRARGNPEALPLPKARTQWVDLRLRGFLARRGEAWLLRERMEGWNPGLWEPPAELARPDERPEESWQRLGLGAARALRPLGEVRHVITRHRIRVEVFSVEDWEGGPQPVISEAVGLTGLARKMLRLQTVVHGAE